MYRLLSHFLVDPALVCQLESDIVLSFNDKQQAANHYYQAAQLYKKDNRILESAAIYEHLLVIKPENKKYRIVIIDLYNQLNIQSKVKAHAMVLVGYLLQNERLDAIEKIMKKIDPGIRVLIKQVCDEYKNKNIE